MRFTYAILLTLSLFLTTEASANKKAAKSIHQQIHTELLANVKSGIDKSVVEDYFKLDINKEPEIDPVFGTLSEESKEMIADLLSEANSHKGKRYRSGAKGPSNFDCSGFTSYVYNQFGYKLNASSRGQYSDGTSVEKGDLRPGDLVFFTGRNSNGPIGHVGIVVKADNENNSFTFIHAAVSGGIQIDRSSAPYYSKRYIGARRIITD